MDTDYVTKSMLQWEHLIFIAYTVIFLVLARYTYQFKLFFFLRSRKDVEGYTCVRRRGPGPAVGARPRRQRVPADRTPAVPAALTPFPQASRRVPQGHDRR